MLTFIKLYNDAKMPKKATTGSAGYDLYTHNTPHSGGVWTGKLSVGVSVIIPVGYVGLLAVRSSAALDGYILKNAVGVIDSDYRGEIIAHLYNSKPAPDTGKSILQMVVVPIYTGSDNTASAENLRVGGFGSTTQEIVSGGVLC